MRIATSLVLLSLAGLASADRLVYVPVGRKIPFREYRYEIQMTGDRSQAISQAFAYGIGTSFDVELVTSATPQNDRAETFSFSYNYLAPLTALAPGFSLGMTDVMGRTEDGRQAYMALTFREPTYTVNGEVPNEITFGFAAGDKGGFFLGLMQPFSREVRLLVEHNGRRPVAGLEVRPRKGIALRWTIQSSRAAISASFSGKF